MIIEKLKIYGYGKFHNKTIDFKSPNLQIIYGENEAGKSTIMSFIHSILFGFPSKQQSLNRYEPKGGGTAYGGYLIVRSNENQLLKIERLPGKAGGDLRIERESGQILEASYLQNLLGGVDRETYKAIFSFDIHGLQQIHKLNADQIGKFLFFSSIYGADALFSIEGSLGKEQELLFKPNGRRPILNEALVKLKENSQNVLEAKRKNNEYQQLLIQKSSLEGELSSLYQTKKELEIKKRRLEKLQSLYPLVRERIWCIEQINLLPDTKHFPEDGLKLLEQYDLIIQPLEAQLYSLQDSLTKYNDEMEKLVINETILEEKNNIQTIREQLPLYKDKKKNYERSEQIISKLAQEIQFFQQRLYPNLTEEEIINIYATIPIKESIKENYKKNQLLTERKKNLDDQFDHEKLALESAEWKIKELRQQLLSEEDRRSMEEQVSKRASVNYSSLKEEYTSVKAQIKNRNKDNKLERNQRSVLFGIIMALLILGSSWLLFENNWLLFNILVAGMIVTVYIYIQISKRKDPLYQHLMERKKILEKEISLFEEHKEGQKTLLELKSLLEKDQRINQELHHELLLYQQYERAYDRILKRYEEWEEQNFQCLEKTAFLANQLKLEEDSSPETLLEAFELLQQIQQLIMEKKQQMILYHQLKQEINVFEHSVFQLAEVCSLRRENAEETVYELWEHAEREGKIHEKLLTLRKKKADVEEEVIKLKNRLQFLYKEKQELLKVAGVDTEDHFRRLGKSQLQKAELLKQKAWIDKQLVQEKEFNLETVVFDENQNIEEELLDIANQLELIEAKDKDTQKNYSAVLLRISEMEQSGTYSQLLQLFENDKAEARELAEQWVMLALARDLLNQTVERHRKERLPALLAFIERYFKKLTANSYQHVFLPDKEQSFIVERSDGMKFSAEELSQATAEQLYLSIRLALVKTMNQQIKLPIILDDSFVHFDHVRTANTLNVLQELKQDNQVIYFTCHKHIANDHFTEGILNLSDITSA